MLCLKIRDGWERSADRSPEPADFCLDPLRLDLCLRCGPLAKLMFLGCALVALLPLGDLGRHQLPPLERIAPIGVGNI